MLIFDHKNMTNVIKTKNITLFALVFSLLAVACDDILETEPQQSLSSETAIQAADDYESAINGAYNALQDVDLGAGALTIYPDIFADNVSFFGSFPTINEIAQQQVNALNPEVEALYADGYTVINQTNIVLDALDRELVPGLDSAFESTIRGEALFLRAMMYFELSRWLCQPWGINENEPNSGLVIRTTPVLSRADVTLGARSTTAELHDQVIIPGLETAIELLPVTNANGRATRFTAMGYLARVRFQRGEYEDAARLAGIILSSGRFSLTTDANGFFVTEFSSESLWELVSRAQDIVVNINITQFTNSRLRDGDVRASVDLVNNGYLKIVTPGQRELIEDVGFTFTDQRVSLLMEARAGTFSSLDNPSSIVHPFKYEDSQTEADNGMPMRLAEFMLMRAEALARSTAGIVNGEALILLNQVRERSIRVINREGQEVDAAPFINYVPSDFGTTEEFIEAIILERRVELAFEGNRYHDLMRLGRPTRFIDGRPGPAPGDDRVIFPIPQDALNANGNLTPNPGFGG